MRRATSGIAGIVVAATIIVSYAAAARVDDGDATRRSALYRELIREVRCPASRNMSIAESTKPVAADRRRELRDLVDAGMNKVQIRRFVARRYGDGALYSPRLREGTLALWLSPVLFLAVGALAWWNIIIRHAGLPLPDD